MQSHSRKIQITSKDQVVADNFEKTAWFLEQIVDTGYEELGSQIAQNFCWGCRRTSSDTGPISKYGLVPKANYPYNWNAMNSSIRNSGLKTKLRQKALTLRRLITA
ncbi:peptidase C1B [Cordyceps militaris]|uniref:Peptidase C1B n=1 Tax=Cordyceps militaris TaxID=73501 RepID=A0A2H4SB34_CORMI|nr:peptidase C1B [Cordyceps militaris]